MMLEKHRCRPDCGACCIAPSISSFIPGMPQGKAAGVRCIQLDDNLLCKLIGSPTRPSVCINFNFDPLICGTYREEAIKIMENLEKLSFCK